MKEGTLTQTAKVNRDIHTEPKVPVDLLSLYQEADLLPGSPEMWTGFIAIVMEKYKTTQVHRVQTYSYMSAPSCNNYASGLSPPTSLTFLPNFFPLEYFKVNPRPHTISAVSTVACISGQ